jgi:hypothetical protein
VLTGYNFGTVQDIALGRNIPMLRTAEEVKAVPEEPYLVKGLLPARGAAARPRMMNGGRNDTSA